MSAWWWMGMGLAATVLVAASGAHWMIVDFVIDRLGARRGA